MSVGKGIVPNEYLLALEEARRVIADAQSFTNYCCIYLTMFEKMFIGAVKQNYRDMNHIQAIY